MKVSILICSFYESKHLSKTVETITATFPRDKYDMELLIDSECKRTGLANTANRYMKLFNKSTGNIIVKSDDDVCYHSNWFEGCIEVILKDPKVAYCGPISHSLMKKLNIHHAMSIRMPIKPKGWNYEPVVSGMCWVLKRELWEKFPYNTVDDWHLDNRYSKIIHTNGLKVATLYGALISHLGQDRYKGVLTDNPGRMPSEDFVKKYKINSEIY